MTPQQMFDPARDAKLSLGDKQRKFTFMIAMLIGYAYAKGYALTFGDAYRDERVHGPPCSARTPVTSSYPCSK